MRFDFSNLFLFDIRVKNKKTVIHTHIDIELAFF